MKLNKYSYQSALLHEECKILYKTNSKQLIKNEVLYRLFSENKKKNEKTEKCLYEKLLIIFGCI